MKHILWVFFLNLSVSTAWWAGVFLDCGGYSDQISQAAKEVAAAHATYLEKVRANSNIA